MDLHEPGAGLGIDVGADVLHCVELAADGRLVRTELVDVRDLRDLVEWVDAVGTVAIDAPAAPSTRPHHDDARLSRKFRSGRCAEIALGREHGIWVPWVSPAEAPFDPWMQVGFRLFAELGARVRVVETYPHGVFRTLAGSRVAPKRAIAGIRERASLLEAAGISAPGLTMWGHDGLDALAAALVARDAAADTARPIGCGHDGSAIWLPA